MSTTTTLEAPAPKTASASETARIFSLDLTTRPPRSPRQRLGGFAILPRALDKGRAKINGKIGEYHYACPLDQRFLNFVGIDPNELAQQLAAGKGDAEILAWIQANAKNKRSDWEISAWSNFQEAKTPDSVKAKERAAAQIAAINAERTDILTGFDLLDLDDYITFGGKA